MPALSTEAIEAERRRLAEAIERTCRSLGVECECPFELPDGARGSVDFAAYLADFGGPLGMVVDPAIGDDGPLHGGARARATTKAGLYFSSLGPGCRVEDEEEFLEALVDWGYYGSLEKLSEPLRRKRALRRSPRARP